MLSKQAASPIEKSKPLRNTKNTKRSQITVENQASSLFIRLRCASRTISAAEDEI
jgi:hypothetical protein